MHTHLPQLSKTNNCTLIYRSYLFFSKTNHCSPDVLSVKARGSEGIALHVAPVYIYAYIYAGAFVFYVVV